MMMLFSSDGSWFKLVVLGRGVNCRQVKLVVAKCWDSSPRGYFLPPHSDEPCRPIDPSAWVAHTEAMRQEGGFFPGGPMAPSAGLVLMPATSAFGQSSSSMDSSSSPMSSLVATTHSQCMLYSHSVLQLS